MTKLTTEAVQGVACQAPAILSATAAWDSLVRSRMTIAASKRTSNDNGSLIFTIWAGQRALYLWLGAARAPWAPAALAAAGGWGPAAVGAPEARLGLPQCIGASYGSSRARIRLVHNDDHLHIKMHVS